MNHSRSKDSVERTAQANVDPLFLERWSPRAFEPTPLAEETLASLFEAARWAPSCLNEQPWLFVYARSEPDRSRFASVLAESNQTWARQAPVLAFVFARRRFSKNDTPNRWAGFDAGAAWMSLALQARLLGLDTHAMGGFDEERVYEALGVPRDDYQAMAAIAIGRRGPAEGLPDALASRERPSPRKDLSAVAHEGGFRRQE
jgi:nitroreductase